MSKTFELGDLLLNLIESHFPEYAKGFCPGVSQAEIQSSLIGLKHVLPDDFYRLYEWRNGNPEYFPQPFPSGDICGFNPINVVAEEMMWEWHGDDPPTYKDYSALPFITMDSEFVAVVIGRAYAEEAHITYINEQGGSHLYCDSITSLLETTVECFLSGAVYKGDEGYIEENQQLSAEIWRSKNPRTLTEAMLDLRVAFSMCDLGSTVENNRYSTAIDLLIPALNTLQVLRPPNSIALVQDNLAKIRKMPSERTKGLEFSLNEWLRVVGV